jgi:crossover junction endodeoxyribonuclease RusA
MMELPWPHPKTFPNAKRRLRWYQYQPHCNQARLDGYMITKGYLATRLDWRPSPECPLPMRVTFYPPDRRHRDDDGMIGAFKHLRDGIADGLGVNDRLFRPEYHFAEPVKGGLITVEMG